MKIRIDQEFAALIPDVPEAEAGELERTVLADGEILNPLIVWAHNNTLLDGHRRHRLLAKHPTLKHPKPIVIGKDWDRQTAHDWIIDHQLSKRNVSDEQRRYLIGKKYADAKKPVGKPNSDTVTELESGATAEKIAKSHGVAARTVERAAEYAEAADAVPAEVKAAVLSGEVKASTKDLQALAELPKGQQKKAAKLIENSEAKTVKDAVKAVAGKPSGGTSFDPTEWEGEPGKDTTGRDLPPALREPFAKRAEFNKSLQQCRDLVATIKKLAEVSPFLHTQSCLADVNNAKQAIKFAKPFAVCPYCKAKGCDACKKTGWVPKNIYESAPSEKKG